MKKKIDDYIKIILNLLNSSESSLILSIQNTSNESIDKKLFYPLPIRTSEKYIFAGLCNSNNEGNIYFLNKLQEKSKYILLDVEKKMSCCENIKKGKYSTNNLEEIIDKILDHKKIIYIWPNTMTVEACLNSIIDKAGIISKLKIGIIGIGNIGFKLALKLTEAGCETSILSRDYEETLFYEKAINKIKPKSTVICPKSFRKVSELVKNQNFLLICTGSSYHLSEEISKNIYPETKILTLSSLKLSAKVNKILEEKNIIIEIIDIHLLYLIEVFKKELFIKCPKPSRKKVSGLWLSSCGYPGKRNDLIVDNANNPKVVLGKIDKEGNFCRDISLWREII